MPIKNHKKLITQVKKVLKKYPKVKLAYFFGSQITGNVGPMSDYDFAVYADEKNPLQLSNLQLKLFADLSSILKTDKVDVVVLNNVKSPELKYNIIKNGRLIYEKEPFRVLIEPKILREYFDFHSMLVRYNLTKSL